MWHYGLSWPHCEGHKVQFAVVIFALLFFVFLSRCGLTRQTSSWSDWEITRCVGHSRTTHRSDRWGTNLVTVMLIKQHLIQLFKRFLCSEMEIGAVSDGETIQKLIPFLNMKRKAMRRRRCFDLMIVFEVEKQFWVFEINLELRWLMEWKLIFFSKQKNLLKRDDLMSLGPFFSLFSDNLCTKQLIS